MASFELMSDDALQSKIDKLKQSGERQGRVMASFELMSDEALQNKIDELKQSGERRG